MKLVASAADRRVEWQWVDRTFWIENALPRHRYGNGKQTWRPEELGVRWSRQRVDGGPWGEWQFSGEIRGTRVKLDGSPSKATIVRERIGSWMDLEDRELATEIELTRPGGVDTP